MNLGDVRVILETNDPIPTPELVAGLVFVFAAAPAKALAPFPAELGFLRGGNVLGGMGVSGPFASRDSVVMIDDGIGDCEPCPEADPDLDPEPVENLLITPDIRFEKLGVVDFVLC